MESLVVLGLSCNTRHVGLAILKRNLLVDYHITLRKEPWTRTKRDLIIASLHSSCKTYSINHIAMSIPYEKQLSSQTKELFESLISYFNEKKIKLFSYPTKTLYVFCEENGAKTKKEVMRKLALLYPELATYYHKEKRNKNKYFVKLFEAVGIATLHVQQLNRK